VSYYALPPEFTGIFEDADRVVKNWHLFFCVACGLWGGLVIGIATEYFTSNRYRPVQARRRAHPDLECSGAPGPPGRARPGSRPRGCLSGALCQRSRACLAGGVRACVDRRSRCAARLAVTVACSAHPTASWPCLLQTSVQKYVLAEMPLMYYPICWYAINTPESPSQQRQRARARRTWRTRAAPARPPTSSSGWRSATRAPSSPASSSLSPSTSASRSRPCTASPAPRSAC